jgi:hypothetical protein
MRVVDLRDRTAYDEPRISKFRVEPNTPSKSNQDNLLRGLWKSAKSRRKWTRAKENRKWNREMGDRWSGREEHRKTPEKFPIRNLEAVAEEWLTENSARTGSRLENSVATGDAAGVASSEALLESPNRDGEHVRGTLV